MPSNLLTPFLELDDEFCRNFRSLDVADGAVAAAQTQRAVGFQRRHSLCPVTLPNSKFNSGTAEPGDEFTCCPLLQHTQHTWSREQQQQLPRSSLSQIPFRVDRSVSMIESSYARSSPTCEQVQPMCSSLPPPGVSVSASSLSSSKSPLSTSPVSTRYKTELCRTYEESGTCKYGGKCQFAHGTEELRGLSRHPKYKTEPCRTFHTIGFCPYGARCHFIHNADEQRVGAGSTPPPRERPRLLRQSISFAGFSSQPPSGLHTLQEPLALSRASSGSPAFSGGSPGLLSPALSDLGTLFPSDLGSEQLSARFHPMTDSNGYRSCALRHTERSGGRGTSTSLSVSVLRRSESAESLSDQDGYTSSSSLSSCESPSFEGRRLPIFSRLSVSDC
ncbi:mRNA decay activator protein ZFP36L1 [Scleropages formosus]|uniref:mRNA decay activator protein ZFP36 n=1 Tax=Scleropages formosus TaxID=113540 RepID=A0A8C9TT67_SCLFO|nr:mRNA decay activator protein ZFP36L1-like [Scleropages formosus]